MALLKDSWKFSFQLYGGWSFADSGAFHTVEEFWQGMAHIPTPSQLLVSLEGPREAFLGEERENVRGMILSRAPVVLEWKYPGMQFIYQFETLDMSGEEMNKEFETYCVNAVTEQYPSLLGFRLLDRSKKGGVSHRWEFWCAGKEEALEKIVASRRGTVQSVEQQSRVKKKQ